MIRGTTSLIAHLGYPTNSFKAPMIYNPYFEHVGIDAVVMPMGCRAENFSEVLQAVFSLTNIRGALITMPHKVSVVSHLDETSPAVRIAGSCNAVRRDDDGRLVGDMFDGEGFVRGLLRKGCTLAGAKVLVVGSGGVGSAIAASLSVRVAAARCRMTSAASHPVPASSSARSCSGSVVGGSVASDITSPYWPVALIASGAGRSSLS